MSSALYKPFQITVPKSVPGSSLINSVAHNNDPLGMVVPGEGLAKEGLEVGARAALPSTAELLGQRVPMRQVVTPVLQSRGGQTAIKSLGIGGGVFLAGLGGAAVVNGVYQGQQGVIAAHTAEIQAQDVANVNTHTQTRADVVTGKAVGISSEDLGKIFLQGTAPDNNPASAESQRARNDSTSANIADAFKEAIPLVLIGGALVAAVVLLRK